VDPGNSQVTREINLRSILDGGEQVFGGTVSIDVGEEPRWLDGVVSSAGSSKVVRSGD